jgi:hypothetical protein
VHLEEPEGGHMKALLIGCGEIGKGVYEVFKEYHDITPYDTNGQYKRPKGDYKILLVCIPWQENFVDIVNGYINLHHITSTIIFSTVPIGTTRKISNAVHAPIEGKHPRLKESIENWDFMIGGENKTAWRFFTTAGIYPMEVTPECTEIAKLQSTALYGLNIEFARYVNEVCKQNNVNYEHIKMYNIAYNALYKALGMQQFQRYILDPPEGNIGGHCVVPNAKMLDLQYPSVLLKEIYKEK